MCWQKQGKQAVTGQLVSYITEFMKHCFVSNMTYGFLRSKDHD